MISERWMSVGLALLAASCCSTQDRVAEPIPAPTTAAVFGMADFANDFTPVFAVEVPLVPPAQPGRPRVIAGTIVVGAAFELRFKQDGGGLVILPAGAYEVVIQDFARPQAVPRVWIDGERVMVRDQGTTGEAVSSITLVDDPLRNDKGEFYLMICGGKLPAGGGAEKLDGVVLEGTMRATGRLKGMSVQDCVTNPDPKPPPGLIIRGNALVDGPASYGLLCGIGERQVGEPVDGVGKVMLRPLSPYQIAGKNDAGEDVNHDLEKGSKYLLRVDDLGGASPSAELFAMRDDKTPIGSGKEVVIQKQATSGFATTNLTSFTTITQASERYIDLLLCDGPINSDSANPNGCVFRLTPKTKTVRTKAKVY